MLTEREREREREPGHEAQDYYKKRYGSDAPVFPICEATAVGVAFGRYGDAINIAYPGSKTRRGRIGVEVAQAVLTGCTQVVIEERRCNMEDKDIEVVGMLDIDAYDHSRRVHGENGISPTATAVSGGTHHIKIFDTSKHRVRKLTPTEYGRLQGFPMDTWNQVVSNSQAYKQFGNAVTVPLAEAIGSNIIIFLDKALGGATV